MAAPRRPLLSTRVRLAACAVLMAAAALIPTRLLGGSDDNGFWAAMRQDYGQRFGMRRSAYQSEAPRGLAIFRPRERLRPVQAPSYEAASVAPHQRYVCARLCDGEDLVLGLGGAGLDEEDYARMCKAAGGGAETVLMTAALDGSGARLQRGRGGEFPSTEALLDDLHGRDAPTLCPADIADTPLSVPLEADPTLKEGDIIATADGFKVFVGGGQSLPHAARSFADIETARRISPSLRRTLGKLRIAEGG